MPVSRPVGFVAVADGAWLLTTVLTDETAQPLLERAPLHAIPIASCPIDSGIERRDWLARRRMEALLVDEADVDDRRAGWSAQQVQDALQRQLPLASDPVVTHDDFSLNNILLHDGRMAGCIDLGRVGLADRYQDLAILSAGLAEFREALPARLFASYGIGAVVDAKGEVHLLLDKLFQLVRRWQSVGDLGKPAGAGGDGVRNLLVSQRLITCYYGLLAIALIVFYSG